MFPLCRTELEHFELRRESEGKKKDTYLFPTGTRSNSEEESLAKLHFPGANL